jgi:hypothetical protein
MIRDANTTPITVRLKPDTSEADDPHQGETRECPACAGSVIS